MQSNIDFNPFEMQELIEEVSKQKPNQTKVRLLTKKLDIKFSADPIEQMTLVLQKIDVGAFGKYSKDLQIQESE